MRALTIDAYWAWAIIHAGKTVENRTWRTAYRGPLVIHAGLTRLRDQWAIDELNRLGLAPPDAPIRGAIIGWVELVDVVELQEVPDANVWATGPYCWLLANPLAIEPVTMPGKQGLWIPPTPLQLPITE